MSDISVLARKFLQDAFKKNPELSLSQFRQKASLRGLTKDDAEKFAKELEQQGLVRVKRIPNREDTIVLEWDGFDWRW